MNRGAVVPEGGRVVDRQITEGLPGHALEEAREQSRLHGLSCYGSLIVHCAKKSGCPTVFTEDMQHGQLIDGVRIVNPFIETA